MTQRRRSMAGLTLLLVISCYSSNVQCTVSLRDAMCDNDNQIVHIAFANSLLDATSQGDVALQPPRRSYHALTPVMIGPDRTAGFVTSGGCQDLRVDGSNFSLIALSDAWLYNTHTHTWSPIKTQGDSAPGKTYGHAMAATVDGLAVIMFGGIVPEPHVYESWEMDYCVSSMIVGTQFYDQTWLLRQPSDQLSREWQPLSFKKGPMPAGRVGHSLTTTSKGIVLFGGTNGRKGKGPFQDVWLLRQLTPSNNYTFKWQQLNTTSASHEFPHARFGHTAVVFNISSDSQKGQGWSEYLFVFGGTSSVQTTFTAEQTVFNDLWKLNLDTMEWTKAPALQTAPPPRFFHGAYTDGGRVLIVHGGAGNNSNHLRDFWTYTVGPNEWTQLQPWFFPRSGNEQRVRTVEEDFEYRDVWAQNGMFLPSDMTSSISFLSFGGLLAMEYYHQTINDLIEYTIFSASEKNDMLVQWRKSPLGVPFPRRGADAAAVLQPGPPVEPNLGNDNCRCNSSIEFTWNGQALSGCVRPSDYSQYICMVDANDCDIVSTWSVRNGHPPQLKLPSKGFTYYWKICSQSTIAVYGGVYNGDSDHPNVVDEPGTVWMIDVESSDNAWRQDDHLLSHHDPPSLSDHSLLSYFDEQVDNWALLLYGGVRYDDNQRSLTCDVYRYVPAHDKLLGQWTRLFDCESPQSAATVRDLQLRRSAHASAIVYGGSSVTMYVTGGFYFSNWAHMQPVDVMLVAFDVKSSFWKAIEALHPPSPRFYHSVAVMNLRTPTLVVFGGMQPSPSTPGTKQLLNDVYIWQPGSDSWANVTIVPPRSTPSGRSEHQVAAFGSKMVVLGGRISAQSDAHCAAIPPSCVSRQVWQLDLSRLDFDHPNASDVNWLQLTDLQDNDDEAIRAGAALFAGERLFVFAGLRGNRSQPSSSLNSLRPGCPQGSFSPDFWHQPCNFCPNETYSTEAGSSCCLPCASGTSADHEGAKNPSECSRCAHGYCKNGATCRLAGGEYNRSPKCHCRTIYAMSERCEVPLLVIIPIIVVCIIATTLGALKGYQKWRHNKKLKRMQLLQSQRELEQMSQGWHIDADEIELLERIDTQVRGAVGEVWRGKWQGMEVAVKKLHAALLELDEAASRQDFDREIRFLRSCRHANIVLFFGAGELDNVPFLVTEYMHHGSLRQVLEDGEIAIDASLRTRFALDAAKGMRFLHMCNPPRIHRDLKTGNLLVNGSWTVKVADFGTSRLLELTMGDNSTGSTAQPRQTKGTRPKDASLARSAMSDSAGLQDMTLTTDIGTPLYQAPELIEDKPYTEKIDVYSFGIVLWEIYHRATPYEEVSVRSVGRLRAMIVDGLRPRVSPSCPAAWHRLMTQCWAGNASVRPSFDAVVTRLTDMANDPTFDLARPVSKDATGRHTSFRKGSKYRRRRPRRRGDTMGKRASIHDIGSDALAAVVAESARVDSGMAAPSQSRAVQSRRPCMDMAVSLPPGSFSINMPDSEDSDVQTRPMAHSEGSSSDFYSEDPSSTRQAASEKTPLLLTR